MDLNEWADWEDAQAEREWRDDVEEMEEEDEVEFLREDFGFFGDEALCGE